MNYYDLFRAVCEVLLLIFMVLVFPKLRALLAAKIGDEDTEKILRIVEEFVGAAEQVGKVLSYTGEQKKDYVIKLLQDIGYEISPIIDAHIEAAVFKMKKGGV